MAGEEGFAMCLAVPGKIIERIEEETLPMARIDFGGVVRKACLAYVPEAKVGDYVLVHVGFAISRVDEKEAKETLELLAQIEQVELPEDKPDEVR